MSKLFTDSNNSNHKKQVANDLGRQFWKRMRRRSMERTQKLRSAALYTFFAFQFDSVNNEVVYIIEKLFCVSAVLYLCWRRSFEPVEKKNSSLPNVFISGTPAVFFLLTDKAFHGILKNCVSIIPL